MAAAHGQRDEAARTHFNFTLELGPPPCAYRVFAIPDEEPRSHLLATVRADPAYVHRWAPSAACLCCGCACEWCVAMAVALTGVEVGWGRSSGRHLCSCRYKVAPTGSGRTVPPPQHTLFAPT
jgi:hypothetical protein